MYIGSTVVFKDRINQHNSLLRRGHTNKALQNAVDKYGVDNFHFKILEYHTEPNKDNVTQMEDFWIQHYRSSGINLYNIRENASNNAGVRHSESVKQAQSKRAKEYWRDNAGDASRYAKERWLDPDCRERMIVNHCKYKAIIRHKDGRELTITNAYAFSQSIGAHGTHFKNMLLGKNKSCKGWTLVTLLEGK